LSILIVFCVAYSLILVYKRKHWGPSKPKKFSAGNQQLEKLY